MIVYNVNNPSMAKNNQIHLDQNINWWVGLGKTFTFPSNYKILCDKFV